MADQQAEEERRRELPSPDEANAIVQAAGFTPKRTEALMAKPLIGSFAEADEVLHAPPRDHWTKGLAADDRRIQGLQKARAENKLIAEARAVAEAKARIDAA